MNGRAARVWIAVFAVVVFLGGIGAGFLIGARVDGPRPPAGPPWGSPPRDMGFGPGALVERLAGDLDLDAAQREQLQVIFAKRRAKLQAFNREVRERFEAEQRELREEIQKVLTPQQMERFEKVVRPGPRGFRRGRRPDRP